MPKLFWKDEELYTFTQADRDLLIRALEGEAGKDAAESREGLAVAVCMVNRWAMMLSLPWYRRLLLQKPEAKVYGYDSFDDMLHAYSQPVNFAWLNGGRKDSDPTHVDAQEQRRESLLTRPIESFPQGIRNLVNCLLGMDAKADAPLNLMKGVPADMAGLVHFFCPAIYYAKKLGKRPRDLTPAEVETANRTHYGNRDKNLIYAQPSGVSVRSNAFYRIGSTKGWKPDWVRVI